MTSTPLSDAELDAAAERLAGDIANGDHFPGWLSATLDLDAALAVQVRLLRRLQAQGAQLAGWKVGLTSARARAALGADVRPFGFILTGGVLPSGAEVPTSTIRHPSIEPEFLFTIARRLAGPDLSPDDVRAGTGHVAAGFELNERRAGTARPDLVAMATDRMTQWGVVEGSGTDVHGVDLDEVEVRMWCDGEERLATRSRDEVDDHWTSIARLAAELHRHGVALEPGQKVITGGLARFDLTAGQRWRAVFDGIGDVEIVGA
jgi:2-keto-4-pentenoate hydratase